MRTKPINLLLQVFLCSAPPPSPASRKKTATGSCEMHRIERPLWHRAASGLEHGSGTTPITTVISKRSGYIRTVGTQWLRRRGESVVVRTEPINLLLQVFLCSAPTPPAASSKKTATDSCEVHRIERPPWHCAASGLEHARGTTPITTVISKRSGYIRTVGTQWLRRRGESVVMRTKPINLLLQVFLCSAPPPSPASRKKTATGSCEVHRIKRPLWHRAASGLEHGRGTTPITTVISKRSGYIRTVGTQWLRRRGESVVVRTEPINLLLQVFLCSAPTPPAASSKKTATDSCEVHRIERPPWHCAASGLGHLRGTRPITDGDIPAQRLHKDSRHPVVLWASRKCVHED
ncbi:hypothetical protein MRX96_037569 [Rhipicephalus microplus]